MPAAQIQILPGTPCPPRATYNAIGDLLFALGEMRCLRIQGSYPSALPEDHATCHLLCSRAMLTGRHEWLVGWEEDLRAARSLERRKVARWYCEISRLMQNSSVARVVNLGK
jgi:hypothetical protein